MAHSGQVHHEGAIATRTPALFHTTLIFMFFTPNDTCANEAGTRCSSLLSKLILLRSTGTDRILPGLSLGYLSRAPLTPYNELNHFGIKVEWRWRSASFSLLLVIRKTLPPRCNLRCTSLAVKCKRVCVQTKTGEWGGGGYLHSPTPT